MMKRCLSRLRSKKMCGPWAAAQAKPIVRRPPILKGVTAIAVSLLVFGADLAMPASAAKDPSPG